MTDFQKAMSRTSDTVAIGFNRVAVKNTLAKHSLGERVKIVKSVRDTTPAPGAGTMGKAEKTRRTITYNVYIDEKFAGSAPKLSRAISKAQRKLKRMTEERDYKDEYNKFQKSPQKKKYRAELNKYNRNKGTYGNNDKKDASHKGGKIVGLEDQSTNRGRREKSRLKKESMKLTDLVREVLNEAGPVGKVQTILMKVLAGVHRKATVELSDLARDTMFRGIHFVRIQKAAKALQQKGLVNYDGISKISMK